MKVKESKPGAIHLRIVEVMKLFPDGVSGGQIRQELEKQGLKPEDQTHLDRRKRDLKKWFTIRKIPASLVVDGKKRRRRSTNTSARGRASLMKSKLAISLGKRSSLYR
jgi:hypothetical protein